MRRCLKEMLDNAVQGQYDKDVAVPATVEDPAVVEKAKAAVKEYFTRDDGQTVKAKL